MIPNLRVGTLDHMSSPSLFVSAHVFQDGDEAILTSLEGAVKVIDTNVDLLTEYYNGLVSDKAWTASQTLQEIRAKDLDTTTE